jgi:hypothetical protein
LGLLVIALWHHWTSLIVLLGTFLIVLWGIRWLLLRIFYWRCIIIYLLATWVALLWALMVVLRSTIDWLWGLPEAHWHPHILQFCSLSRWSTHHNHGLLDQSWWHANFRLICEGKIRVQRRDISFAIIPLGHFVNRL